MTVSPDDPTAEAAAAPSERPDTAQSRPLPRRSRGPSAIAEAGAALGLGTRDQDTPGAEPDPAPPMSAAAAEFAALTAAAPDTDEGTDSDPATRGRTRATDVADTAAVPPAPLPGRSRKALLAGAALAGALLIGIPFLVSGGDGDEKRATASDDGTADVVGNEGNAHVTGTFDSASPSDGAASPRASATDDTPAKDRTASPDGSQTPGRTSGDTKNGDAGTGTSSIQPSAENSPGAVPGVPVVGTASGRCIDVTGGSTRDRTPLQIWDCVGAARQKWQFAADGTVRALGKCMNVNGGSRDDGAAIQLVACNGTGAQRFRLNAAHDLVNVQADKCVDVRDMGTDNGTRLQLWTCGGTDNQKWSAG
ncbi:RICIN domain-containing protein [Streptomyces sp. NPDC096132]|uniref:RICIN domain-containing protein n=1 Tax=Streptomyces sp. NPDC096132 TaxID=3366075 RepID=UPI0037FA5411